MKLLGNQARQTLRKNYPILQRVSQRLKAKTWDKGSIVYYTGNRKNGLSPHVLAEGASGTDVAVVNLSREWAKLGRRVTVYSNCGDREGIYEGVEYLNHYKFNPYDRFDSLVILAHPYLLSLPTRARHVYWDWHDVLGNEKIYPREKIRRFDHIFSKSNFQRNLLPEVPDHRFTIVNNGIDQNIFLLPKKNKNPYKLIYASRYYRGLDLMLEFGWPIIKKHLPEAELYIYHGWVRRELRPKYDNWRKKMNALFQQEGVFEKGRVSQATLIAEKATASIHYYACTYPEIDCISIRESAAVGCVPVTTDFAVFKEKNYCIRVAGEPKEKETQEAVALKIVALLQNPDYLARIQSDFQAAVRRETWQEVAKVWLRTFEAQDSSISIS